MRHSQHLSSAPPNVRPTKVRSSLGLHFCQRNAQLPTSSVALVPVEMLVTDRGGRMGGNRPGGERPSKLANGAKILEIPPPPEREQLRYAPRTFP